MAILVDDQLAAAVAVAPRVTIDDLKDNIVSEAVFVLSDALETMNGRGADYPAHRSFEILTICVLVTRNGFTIVGKSSPASPENFNAEVGATLAKDDALRQLWPLMGYALRDRLAA